MLLILSSPSPTLQQPCCLPGTADWTGQDSGRPSPAAPDIMSPLLQGPEHNFRPSKATPLCNWSKGQRRGWPSAAPARGISAQFSRAHLLSQNIPSTVVEFKVFHSVLVLAYSSPQVPVFTEMLLMSGAQKGHCSMGAEEAGPAGQHSGAMLQLSHGDSKICHESPKGPLSLQIS